LSWERRRPACSRCGANTYEAELATGEGVLQRRQQVGDRAATTPCRKSKEYGFMSSLIRYFLGRTQRQSAIDSDKKS
jgi:hypothetical protein